MSTIKINEIVNSEPAFQYISANDAANIVGGKKGGKKGRGGDEGGFGFGGSDDVDQFIFDEIGPGNSRRDRFVVSPNGDVFQYNRKGNSKRSFSYNPGFARED